MTFFRSLALNFLLVFFINRIAPSVQIDLFQDVFNLGADLFFAFAVGFLNAAIFPCLQILSIKATYWKMGVLAAIISYGAYGLVWIFPMGVFVTGPLGFLFAGTAVSGISFFTNYMELKRSQNK